MNKYQLTDDQLRLVSQTAVSNPVVTDVWLERNHVAAMARELLKLRGANSREDAVDACASLKVKHNLTALEVGKAAALLRVGEPLFLESK